MSDYNHLYKAVANKLPYQHRQFATDWVHETMASWMDNDSFFSYLEKGKTPSNLTMIKLIMVRCCSIRDRYGKNAVNRSLGMVTRTEREGRGQNPKATHFMLESISYELDEDGLEDKTDFHIYDNSFERSSSVDQDIVGIKAYVMENMTEKFKVYFPEFLEYYFLGYSQQEIGNFLNIERDVVVIIMAKVREISQKGRRLGVI